MSSTTTTIVGNVTATGNLTGTFLYGDGSNINLPGANDHVAILDPGTGRLSSEATLSTARGGTGADTSGETGFAYVTAGTWSYSNSPVVIIGPNATTGTMCKFVKSDDDTPKVIAQFGVAPLGVNTKTTTTVSFEAVCGRMGDVPGDINMEAWFAEYEITYNTTGDIAVVTKVKETKSGTLPAYVIAITGSSSNINVEVTGAVATSVNWALVLRYVSVSFAD